MYEPKIYRHWVKDADLVSFNVNVKETDLYIRAQRNLEREALRAILKYRSAIEGYIKRHPEFLTTLKPIPIPKEAPQIVKEMSLASKTVSVGPLASVAGAIAQNVGKALLASSPEVIVENGGDIFLKLLKERIIGIYAGNSPLSGRIALKVTPEDTPLGICTSSGTVGHSLSFGKADAVVAIAHSAAFADAAATAIGNIVKKIADIPEGIALARELKELRGILIIKDEQLGIWGKINMTAL